MWATTKISNQTLSFWWNGPDRNKFSVCTKYLSHRCSYFRHGCRDDELAANGIYSSIWRLTSIWGGGHLQPCGRTRGTAISAVRMNHCMYCSLKGSVERSLLLRAIFLIFTRNRPWMSEDHLCTLFFIEMSKERLEKSKRTPPVLWRPWALRTAAIDRTTFRACLRCRKTAVFAVFSRLWGVIWRGKAFRDQQCQFLTRNKSLRSQNESNCLMTSECVRIDSILPRGAGLDHGRCKQSIFSLSIFGILVERLSL